MVIQCGGGVHKMPACMCIEKGSGSSADQLSKWRQVFQAMVPTLSPCVTPSLLSARAHSLALSCTSAYVDRTTGPSTVRVTTTCRPMRLQVAVFQLQYFEALSICLPCGYRGGIQRLQRMYLLGVPSGCIIEDSTQQQRVIL